MCPPPQLNILSGDAVTAMMKVLFPEIEYIEIEDSGNTFSFNGQNAGRQVYIMISMWNALLSIDAFTDY